MKRCPECRRDYVDDSLLYCLEDGAALIQGSVPLADEPATAILSEPAAVATGFRPDGGSSESPTVHLQPPASQAGTDPSTKHQKWRAIAAAALLLIGGVSYAVYKFWPKPDKPPQAMKIERLTTNGKSTDAAISPDGKYVVYILDEGGQRSLWTRLVATTSNVQIIPPADVRYLGLVFSPDSNYINFVKREKSDVPPALYQMPVLGGAQKKLISVVSGGVGYSPDGKQFAFVRNSFPTPNESSLLIANSDGTGERILASRQRPEEFPTVGGQHPAWSPDGKTIACITYDGAGNSAKVAEVQVADGTVKPITAQGWNFIRRIAWLPDKSGLLILGADKTSAFTNQQIWRISYPDGEARRITTDFNDYIGMGLAADSGTLAAVQSNRLSNIWVAPNGNAERAAQIKSGGNNLDGTHSLAWTPDGRIVYYSFASGASDIWIMNGDGSGQKQLTVEAGANLGARVTPDGRYIVFSSPRSDGSNIWRMDLDGGNPRQLTSGNREYDAAVSPDSRWVIYASQSLGYERLWKVSIDGGSPVQVTDYLSRSPKVSPDGKLIVSRYREGGNLPWRYAIIPFEGGKPVKIFDLPLSTGNFLWSKDSRSLMYIGREGGVGNIWSFPLDGTPPKQLTNFKSEEIYNFDWSADGKQLVTARGTTTSDVVLISNFK